MSEDHTEMSFSTKCVLAGYFAVIACVVVANGIDDLASDETKAWTGAWAKSAWENATSWIPEGSEPELLEPQEVSDANLQIENPPQPD